MIALGLNIGGNFYNSFDFKQGKGCLNTSHRSGCHLNSVCPKGNIFCIAI